MSAHAHATAQHALDFPALLRKNGWLFITLYCLWLHTCTYYCSQVSINIFDYIKPYKKQKKKLSVQKS